MTTPDSTINDTPDQSGRYTIYGTTVITSLLLMIIHKGIAHDWALFDSYTVRCIWYSSIIGTALTLTLLVNARRTLFIWLASVGCLGILALLATHTGNAYLPDVQIQGGSIFVPYTLCLFLALFILIPFLQVWRDGLQTLSYARLYQLSWDNGLTLLTAIIFTAAGWLILYLFAGLFSVIGIDFFDELFDEIEFIYPVSGLFAGFGIGLGRTQIGAMRVTLNVCLAIARPLLPLICGIALFFLTALAFNNIQALWDTGRATVLLLCLVLGTVTLLNAVYQDGKNDKPYSFPMIILVGIGLISLPLFSFIASYAIYLRVEQYGWSVDRLYAAFITLFTGIYAFGYAAASLHSFLRPARWLAGIGTVNTVTALLLAFFLLLSQSPLLDFRQITVRSQLARIHNLKLEWEKLDLGYFRFNLGAPGYLALKALAESDTEQTTASFQARLKDILAAENMFQLPVRNEWAEAIRTGDIPTLPASAEIPEALLEYMESEAKGVMHIRHPQTCTPDQNDCRFLLKIDLSEHAEDEWILLDTSMFNCRATVFSKASGSWTQAGHLVAASSCNRELITRALRSGDYRAQPPDIKNLQIGRETLHFQSGPKVP